MKIQAIALNNIEAKTNNGTSNVKSKEDVASRSSLADSVEISTEIVAGNIAEQIDYSEFTPRVETVNEVTKKISSGYYKDSEVVNSVARSVVNSPAINDGIIAESDTTNSVNTSDISGKLEIASQKVSSGYYDDYEIMNNIAQTIIDNLNLSTLINK